MILRLLFPAKGIPFLAMTYQEGWAGDLQNDSAVCITSEAFPFLSLSFLLPPRGGFEQFMYSTRWLSLTIQPCRLEPSATLLPRVYKLQPGSRKDLQEPGTSC